MECPLAAGAFSVFSQESKFVNKFLHNFFCVPFRFVDGTDKRKLVPENVSHNMILCLLSYSVHMSATAG